MLQWAPKISNGPTHLGLCVLQAAEARNQSLQQEILAEQGHQQAVAALGSAELESAADAGRSQLSMAFGRASPGASPTNPAAGDELLEERARSSGDGTRAAEAGADAPRKIQSLQEEMKLKDDHISSLEGELSAGHAEVQALRARHSGAQSKVANHSEVKAELAASLAEIETLKDEMRRRVDQAAGLEAELRASRGQLDASRAAAKELKAQHAAAQEQDPTTWTILQ